MADDDAVPERRADNRRDIFDYRLTQVEKDVVEALRIGTKNEATLALLTQNFTRSEATMNRMEDKMDGLRSVLIQAAVGIAGSSILSALLVFGVFK